MKSIFALLAALGMSASLHAAPLQTQAMEESNTVPSNELITDYDIIKTAGEPDAAVDVTFLEPVKGAMAQACSRFQTMKRSPSPCRISRLFANPPWIEDRIP